MKRQLEKLNARPGIFTKDIASSEYAGYNIKASLART